MLHSISLLDRIEHLELDDPTASLPFSARLARETGWSADYTERAIREYKRFIYLTTIASHPLTPSVAVDEVWHFHLTYTRSYWNQLCGEVLGKPLHHDPSWDGPAESARSRDLYGQTLALYEQTFGSAPPPGIWPSVAERFASSPTIAPVSPESHWIIRKPSLLDVQITTALALLAAVLWATDMYPRWDTVKNIVGPVVSWVFNAAASAQYAWNSVGDVILSIMLLVVGVMAVGCVALLPLGLVLSLLNLIFKKVTGRSKRSPASYVAARGGNTRRNHVVVIAGSDGGDNDDNDHSGDSGDSGDSGCGGCDCGD